MRAMGLVQLESASLGGIVLWDVKASCYTTIQAHPSVSHIPHSIFWIESMIPDKMNSEIKKFP
jgi:hypothetical protein